MSDADWTARKNLYHGTGALPERQAVPQREQFRQSGCGITRRAAVGGRQRSRQARGAVYAGAFQFQTGQAAGGGELFPRLRGHQESVPANGNNQSGASENTIHWNQVNLLIPNLGSTSLKYQILEMPSETVLAKGRLERVTNYREAIAQISTGTVAIDAVALKAVHAGPRYRGTFVVDGEVTAALRQFLPAAPAHNAIYLTAIEAFQQAMPGVPIVAAFEPEFHATMPEYARLLRRAGRLAGRRRGKVRLPRRVASVHRGARGGDAGAAGEAGELPSGRKFVDVRDRGRPQRGYDDGVLAAIGIGERHAARRSGRVRGALHDGSSRVERGRSAAATGQGRRAGGAFRRGGRRRARSGSGGHGSGRRWRWTCSSTR